MRIEKIDLFHLRARLRPHNKNRHFFFLRLEMEGMDGWGEAFPLSANYELLKLDFKRNLIPFALQTPFDRIEDFSHLLAVMKTSPEARAALEMAVWDLLTQKEEHFLPNQFPHQKKEIQRVRIFQSEQEPWPDQAGTVLLKISPQNVHTVLKRMKEEGGNHEFILDAQGLFSDQNANELTAFASLPVPFLLDPFPPENWESVRNWRSTWNLQIGALRPAEDVLALERLCQSNLFDWVVVDPWRAGGLEQARRFLEMLTDYQLPAAVLAEGHWPLGLVWAQRLFSGFSNTRLFLMTFPEETFEIKWTKSMQGIYLSNAPMNFSAFFEHLKPWVIEHEAYW